MNLNFNFDAKTLLSKWWTIVRDNFQAIQTEFNNHVSEFTKAKQDLQKKIDDEVTARANADTVLQQSINSEITDRKNADNSLGDRITAETTARQNADNSLRADLNAEISARKNGDSNLQTRLDSAIQRITDLENLDRETLQVDENKVEVDNIFGERIRIWDTVTAKVDKTEFAEYVFGIWEHFRLLWLMMGIKVYDGSLFGTEYTDESLDGGDFTETASETVDCGGLEPITVVFAGESVDGGTY